jgi:hypothetical protein
LEEFNVNKTISAMASSGCGTYEYPLDGADCQTSSVFGSVIGCDDFRMEIEICSLMYKFR